VKILKTKKARGDDEVNIKNLPNKTTLYIKHIFQACINVAAWKKAKITAFHKSGTDPTWRKITVRSDSYTLRAACTADIQHAVLQLQQFDFMQLQFTDHQPVTHEICVAFESEEIVADPSVPGCFNLKKYDMK
jgi:hypothetical protein